MKTQDKKESGVIHLAPKQVRLDAHLQARVHTDQAVVDDYAEAYRAKTPMPAIEVIFDGKDYWPTDGEHRLLGAIKAECPTIEANWRKGTEREARLLALSANQNHGLRRSNADKRNAVRMMLLDEEWSQWSNREIAKHIGVSDPLVGDVRAELNPPPPNNPPAAAASTNPPPASSQTAWDGEKNSQRKGADGKTRTTEPRTNGQRAEGESASHARIKALVSPKFFTFLNGAEASLSEHDWSNLAAKSDDQIRAVEKMMGAGSDFEAAMSALEAPAPTPATKPSSQKPQTKKKEPAEDEDAELTAAVDRIDKVLGGDFRAAIDDGRITLAKGELLSYSTLGDDDLKKAGQAIAENWNYLRFQRVALGRVDSSSKVSDLINKCIASGGAWEGDFGSFLFTVEKR